METYTVETGSYVLKVDCYTRDTINELIARVKLGNDKLNDAWEKLKAMEQGEQWKAGLEGWHKANLLLKCYCDQLQQMGFANCLYIENGIKTRKCLTGLGCRVCPSRISYWEQEFAGLGR